MRVGLENRDLTPAFGGGHWGGRIRAWGHWYSRVVRALLVEDDPTIADFVARGLREAGFAVDQAADGDDGLQLAGAAQLRRRDRRRHAAEAAMASSLIKELRRRQVTTPVLILSARHTVDDRVSGLQAGGDDYLTKPFAFTELLARVQALIRRATAAPASTHLTVGDLTLDLRSRARGRAPAARSSSGRASSRCSNT